MTNRDLEGKYNNTSYSQEVKTLLKNFVNLIIQPNDNQYIINLCNLYSKDSSDDYMYINNDSEKFHPGSICTGVNTVTMADIMNKFNAVYTGDNKNIIDAHILNLIQSDPSNQYKIFTHADILLCLAYIMYWLNDNSIEW